MAVKSEELAKFLGTPRFSVQRVFDGERFPNVVVSTDGTVIAVWGRERLVVRRSGDGGKTWEPAALVVDPGFHGGGALVDAYRDQVLIFAERQHPQETPQRAARGIGVYSSLDHGRTWRRLQASIGQDVHGNVPSLHMCENGITLIRSPKQGRLLRPARVFDRPRGYTTAVFSDDGGATWQPSQPFPDEGTGESALVELENGVICHNTRKHHFEGPSRQYRSHRWAAWSGDAGESWRDLTEIPGIPDGPRYRGAARKGDNYNGHFGIMAGLVRLPVSGCDILLYSSCDTPGHHRVNGTVWASFDGGLTWPLKRCVYEGPFAYSSLAAGRSGTASEGMIFLQFEGGSEHCYEGGFVACFNLAWVLQGQRTGDGRIPEWAARS